MDSLPEKESSNTVVVVGGGFSGTLCALHLVAARPDLQISIIERRPRLGPGLAYGAASPEHILNVPVGRLGFGLEPSFETWLRDTVDPSLLRDALEESGGRLADAFVQRFLFGNYLEELVKRAVEPGRIRWVRGEAVAFLDSPKRGILLADGRDVEASLVVLALGNQAPSPPDGAFDELQDLPEYIADPWAPGATAVIGPEDPVTIIGAGLTMVDVVLMLRHQGHAAKITALSRRGVLPRVHAFGGQWPAFVEALLPLAPSALMHVVRNEARLADAQGVPWQRVIDAIRPAIGRVWESWSSVERQRFLRHLRPWWDAFRHRMPMRVADRIDALVLAGSLDVTAGRLRGYERIDSELELKVAHPRGAGAALRSRHIVNCSGPRTDFSVLSSPIVLDARRKRLIKADQLGLGIESRSCAVVNADGVASNWLYAIGPLTRPARWEITAAPEINAQIIALAHSFIGASMPNVHPDVEYHDPGGEYFI